MAGPERPYYLNSPSGAKTAGKILWHKLFRAKIYGSAALEETLQRQVDDKTSAPSPRDLNTPSVLRMADIKAVSARSFHSFATCRAVF